MYKHGQTSTRRPRNNSNNHFMQLSNQTCSSSRKQIISNSSAYVLPSPLILAAAAVSLSISVVALKKLFPQTHEKLQLHISKVLQVTSKRSRIHLKSESKSLQPNPHQRMDRLRDRSVAKLESERIAFTAVISPDEYAALPSLQRRELLASALSSPSLSKRMLTEKAKQNKPVISTATKKEMNNIPKVQTWRQKLTNNNQQKQSIFSPTNSYMRAAESINGRAAALGFVLCLAREIAEPGHPSLFEQVVDVVVPIAQKTPPFLVAVCDRLVDILT